MEKAGERSPADFREICTESPSGVATDLFLFFPPQIIIEFIMNEIKRGFREKFSGSVQVQMMTGEPRADILICTAGSKT